MKKKKELFRPLESEAFDGAVYLPCDPENTELKFPTVYLLGSEMGELRSIVANLKKRPGWKEHPSALVALHPHAWAHDYSPLAAPALTEGGEPFTPGAEEHLEEIVSKLIPELEKKCPLLPAREARTLAGYSLAGLCALYGAYAASDTFSRFAACSASLWMEGWMAYMKATPLPQSDVRIYLSLGKKEPLTKNPRMARVGSCFEEASALLSSALPVDAFRSEWNDGNHFFEPDRRIARGLAFVSLSPL